MNIILNRKPLSREKKNVSTDTNYQKLSLFEKWI